jgi:hypothetical protein
MFGSARLRRLLARRSCPRDDTFLKIEIEDGAVADDRNDMADTVDTLFRLLCWERRCYAENYGCNYEDSCHGSFSYESGRRVNAGPC